jgi:excisionase family DNA binding protein
MPHRILQLDEAADYLHLTRCDVETLVKRREIPFELRGSLAVFRRQDIDLWASRHLLSSAPSPLNGFHRQATARRKALSKHSALLADLITADRIHPALTSRTKASVLRDMVALADATGLVCDAAALLDELTQREGLCSTGLPGGLALLHPRHHDPYLVTDSLLLLGRTVQPLHTGALDGKPTDLFFLVLCQDDRLHLHTLARLCAIGQSGERLGRLREAGNAEAMLDRLLEAEGEVLRNL